jgi:phage recombination protein Bet
MSATVEVTPGLKFTPEEAKAIRSEFLRPSKRQPTDGELAVFIHHCERTGLSPFDRHIYAQYRWDRIAGDERMQVLSTIDGFRAVAERSGKYLGQDGPFWTSDGKWSDVWLDDSSPPKAAKVGVWKERAKAPTYGVAHFREYAQRNRSGGLTGLWPTMPSNQLAKCAEALALRKAFPNQLSGIYTTEEMAQADNEPPTPQVIVDSKPPASAEPEPEPEPEPVSAVATEPPPDENATVTDRELDALRELIKVAGVSDPAIRMWLIDYGLEDVGAVNDLLPKLTRGQAIALMTRINERAAAA